MYRFGHRQVHHYFLFAIAGLVLVGTVIAGTVVARNVFQAHTVLKQSRPVTHTVTADQTALRTITTSLYSFQLPATWHATTAPHVSYTVSSWTGTGVVGSARHLDVYTDNLPTDLAVNHLLPVDAAGNQLEVIGTVSDNCVNFTDRSAASATTGRASSKWGGVNFWCDMGNYERDVVAVGSASVINQVSLHGSKAGTHQVLLVYTDNNAMPDYTIFIAIAKSFHLL